MPRILTLVKFGFPLLTVAVLMSPAPEYLTGAYLLLRDSLRPTYGEIYGLQENLAAAAAGTRRATAEMQQRQRARRLINSVEGLYSFLQQEPEVVLSREQFLRIYRWLPRDHAVLLLNDRELLFLILEKDLSQILCRRRGSRFRFEFRNSSDSLLKAVELDEKWFRPGRGKLLFISRVNDLSALTAYPAFTPADFLENLDSLASARNWDFDYKQLLNVVDNLKKVVLTAPDELLFITHPDSMYEIWRYQPEVPGRKLHWWQL